MLYAFVYNNIIKKRNGGARCSNSTERPTKSPSGSSMRRLPSSTVKKRNVPIIPSIPMSIDAYYGKVEMWVPKSILITEEKMAEAEANAQDRRDLNDRYNTYLHETAKANGIKLGRIQKWAKIMAKLTEAGVKFMSRDEFATA